MVYISVRKKFLFPPPPPLWKLYFSPSRYTSLFDAQRGLFAIIRPYFAFILPFYFLFSHFLSPSFFFFPLSSFFFYIFPLFLFAFSYFFPQMTSVDIPSPRGVLFSNGACGTGDQWWAAIMENLSVKAMRWFFFLNILSDKATNLIKAFRFEAMNRQIFLWTSIF